MTKPVRDCDGCTLCCKLLRIDEFQKPRGEWCGHCEMGEGCRIYADRPAECQSFLCNYLQDPNLGDDWNPKNSRIVPTYEAESNRLVFHVDPGRVGVWRKEPYYSQIKEWSAVAVQTRGLVIVWQGANVIAVLPDREINLGAVRQDQLIITSEKRGPAGLELDVRVVDRDDPMFEGTGVLSVPPLGQEKPK